MTVNIAHSCTRCYTGITFLSLYNFWLFLDVMTVLFVCLVFFIHNYYQTVSRFAQAPQVTSVRCLSHLLDDRRYNLYSLPLCVPSLQVAPVAAVYMSSWSLPWPASEDLLPSLPQWILDSTSPSVFYITPSFQWNTSPRNVSRKRDSEATYLRSCLLFPIVLILCPHFIGSLARFGILGWKSFSQNFEGTAAVIEFLELL